MVVSSEIQSIRTLKPLNKGGVLARAGFSFQDHIATAFCLEMAIDSELLEVWCETHDDITLIWSIAGHEEVEFVQVKDLDLGQLWTVAKLCERDDARSGTSILEKSLGEERCSEHCRFRIVTSLDVKNELSILSFPLESPRRSSSTSEYKVIADQIEKKIGAIVSPKGNSVKSWLERALWQVEHSSEAISHKNIIALYKIIAEFGYETPLDLIEDKIYPQVLQIVNIAAEIDPDIDLDGKRIICTDFIAKLKIIVEELLHEHKISAGKNIAKKMGDAKIPTDYIDAALEERRLYRQERLSPLYMELSDRDLIEGEVTSNLQTLRLELDSGVKEDGLSFYKDCLSILDDLRESIKTKSTAPSFYFHGCMHDITDRCGHRYLRGRL